MSSKALQGHSTNVWAYNKKNWDTDSIIVKSTSSLTLNKYGRFWSIVVRKSPRNPKTWNQSALVRCTHEFLSASGNSTHTHKRAKNQRTGTQHSLDVRSTSSLTLNVYEKFWSIMVWMSPRNPKTWNTRALVRDSNVLFAGSRLEVIPHQIIDQTRGSWHSSCSATKRLECKTTPRRSTPQPCCYMSPTLEELETHSDAAQDGFPVCVFRDVPTILVERAYMITD